MFHPRPIVVVGYLFVSTKGKLVVWGPGGLGFGSGYPYNPFHPGIPGVQTTEPPNHYIISHYFLAAHRSRVTRVTQPFPTWRVVFPNKTLDLCAVKISCSLNFGGCRFHKSFPGGLKGWDPVLKALEEFYERMPAEARPWWFETRFVEGWKPSKTWKCLDDEPVVIKKQRKQFLLGWMIIDFMLIHVSKWFVKRNLHQSKSNLHFYHWGFQCYLLKPRFLLHIPFPRLVAERVQLTTTSPWGRLQRNGEVDAGDKNLALKMQAWCLQREGVGRPVGLEGKGGWNSMGIFVSVFFLVRKDFHRPQQWPGVVCINESFGLVFGLMVFVLFLSGFQVSVKDLVMFFPFRLCLRPFWDRQEELDCTEHITLVLNFLSFNDRSFSSCFWSGWDTTRIYKIWEYIHIHHTYHMYQIHIKLYHMYLYLLCTDSRSRDIFFISFVQCNTFSTQVLLLLQLYSSCVVASGAARYIARRSWIKRWVLVLLMVQHGWKVAWFWLPSIQKKKTKHMSRWWFSFSFP